MCSVNFSGTSSNFRDMVGKAASDKVISQTELKALSENAQSPDEKNFVNALQSKAEFQDLKLASFDPGSSTISFNLPQKPEQSDSAVKAPDRPVPAPNPGPKTESTHVNLINPIIGALGLILGILGGGIASNDKLDEAVNKSLNDASQAINKYGINTPVIGTIKDEDNDLVARHKKMAEGKD